MTLGLPAEHRRRIHKLQVSFKTLMTCCHFQQKAGKDGKRKHLSDLIVSNGCTHVLFVTFEFVLNEPHTDCTEPFFFWMWKLVCTYFIEEVTFTRAQISLSFHDPSVSVPSSAIFNSFQPVTLSSLQEVVSHCKLTYSTNEASPCSFMDSFSQVAFTPCSFE